jgi:hypothetical protein
MLPAPADVQVTTESKIAVPICAAGHNAEFALAGRLVNTALAPSIIGSGFARHRTHAKPRAGMSKPNARASALFWYRHGSWRVRRRAAVNAE